MIFETLDTDKQKKIQAYLDLVIEKNKELNLTRIETREKGMLLHIEDSLFLYRRVHITGRAVS